MAVSGHFLTSLSLFTVSLSCRFSLCHCQTLGRWAFRVTSYPWNSAWCELMGKNDLYARAWRSAINVPILQISTTWPRIILVDVLQIIVFIILCLQTVRWHGLYNAGIHKHWITIIFRKMTFYIKVLLKQYTMLFYKYRTCIYKIPYFLEFLALSKNATKLP